MPPAGGLSPKRADLQIDDRDGRLRRKNSRNSEETAAALPTTNPAPARNP